MYGPMHGDVHILALLGCWWRYVSCLTHIQPMMTRRYRDTTTPRVILLCLLRLLLLLLLAAAATLLLLLLLLLCLLLLLLLLLLHLLHLPGKVTEIYAQPNTV
jgi:hypothetical protein